MRLLKILLIFLIIVSCGTKQKATQKTNEQVKITKEKATVKITEEKAAVTITEENNLNLVTILEEKNAELTQAEDPSHVIELEDNKGNKLKIKGANAKFNSKTKTESKKDTRVKITEENTQKKDSAAATNKTEIDTDKKERSSNVKTKRTNTWFALGGGIAVVGLLILAYYKRTWIRKVFKIST